MRIKMSGSTHVGRVRKNNQDSFYFDSTHGIAIVADGIGGRKGGEVASQMAVAGMKDEFIKADCLRTEEINPFLSSTVDRVNQGIIERGELDPSIKGMGTTLNFLLFVADKLHIAHLGDSRTYLYDRGHLWQLTLDHNIETFIERGWMKQSDIAPNTQEGDLVRSMGLAGRCEADLYEIKLRSGQIFLTCSDGLTGMVSDRKISEIITQNANNISKLPKVLIDAANQNGGKDNITVVVSQVVGV